MKYLISLTKRAKFKARQCLPNLFSFVFDGWSESATHMIVIFSGVSADNGSGYKTYLLGFSPFENEASQSAEKQKLYAEFVLNLFGKNWNNVAALFGYNCNTNKAFATLLDKPLVGSYSHRFNIAVKDLLETHKNSYSKSTRSNETLKNPIPDALLRQVKHLRAKSNNATRWSSTASML